jgi:hypothetical protein
MSDSTQPSHDPEVSAHAHATGSSPASEVAADLAQQFDAYRKKLLEQIADWGSHVDGVQHKLVAAAAQARQAIEKELAEVKAHHPDAFARIDGLRSTGDESLAELRGRVDRLTADLEKAVGAFLGHLSSPAKPPASPQAEAPAGESSEPPTDKPAT